MRRPAVQFRAIRQRGRAVVDRTRRRLAPARGRVRDWTRRAMASEVAPLPLGRPGPAEKATGVVFLLVLAAILAFLAVFDWNHLRGPIGRWASDRWERSVRLDGDLDVDLFRWAPRVTAQDIRIGPPAWDPKGPDTADIDMLTASVKFWPLWRNEIDMPEIRAVRPRLNLIRDAQGRESWRFGDPTRREPMELPLVRRFVIEDGRIDFRDARRRLVLKGTINSRESIARGERSAFLLEGRGTLNGNPLTLTVRGGPLVNVDRDRPYEFVADLTGGATRLHADGSITRPFDLGRFQAALVASGPDLADLYYVTTLAFPNTPPYRVRGRLTRDEHLYRFDDFSGRVGDSDLSGDLSVRTGRARPYLEADLVSRSLDMDDLFAVVGGPPATGRGETASPEQRAMASRLRAQGRLLPDAKLDVRRLRAMDGEVDFRATRVKANRLRLTQVRIGARLNNAVLDIDPLAFSFARGRLNGSIRLDGRKATPWSNADLRLTGYPIEALIPARGGLPTVEGPVNARVKLAGPGRSVRETVGNASGQAAFVMPRGTMRQAFAELMGINVGKGLGLLLSKDPKQTPVNCAVANFAVTGGTARVQTLVIDTGVVVARGKGSIDLDTERMNLEIDGESKKPRLLRVWAPITVGGTLRRPDLGVKTSEVVKQGGLAAVLGAVIHPLAALLPFLEPGGAEDANCYALERGGRG